MRIRVWYVPYVYGIKYAYGIEHTHFKWGLKIFLLWPLVDKDNEDENSLSLSRSLKLPSIAI